ncbi:MAG TPA: hypothetical protein GX013_08730, partial [Propionibacterium sp.]|nr:hypothetical protein [Propionibacterium sp.]
MKMRVYKLGAVALVSALALAACGGDDATTDPAAPADDQTPAAGGETTAPPAGDDTADAGAGSDLTT